MSQEGNKDSKERIPEAIQIEFADKDFKMTKMSMFKNLKGKNRHKE